MAMWIDLKCPICGTEWSRDFLTIEPDISELVKNRNRKYTVLCPDDEIEGACGNQIVLDVKMVPQVMDYFVKWRGANGLFRNNGEVKNE